MVCCFLNTIGKYPENQGGQFGAIWALAHKCFAFDVSFSLYQKTIGGEKSIKLSEPLLLKRNSGKKGERGTKQRETECEGLRQGDQVLQFSKDLWLSLY